MSCFVALHPRFTYEARFRDAAIKSNSSVCLSVAALPVLRELHTSYSVRQGGLAFFS
jgi:hypothetical protein